MSKPSESASLQASQANLADVMASTGKQSAAEGSTLFNLALPGLTQAESYYGKLASGDPHALARANAPAVEAITKQSGQQKKNIEQNMPRGGERNLALEEADLSKGAQIGNLETGSYLSSFGSLAGLGGQNVGQGTSATSVGLQGMQGAANQYGQMQQINAENKATSMGFIGSLAGAGAEAAGAFCWIAEALWKRGDRRTELVRYWLREVYSRTPFGRLVVAAYRRHGEWVAGHLSPFRFAVQPLFSWFLIQAQGV